MFNWEVLECFECVWDYIVCYYKLNGCNDSDYWRDNRVNMKLFELLFSLLDVWYRKGDIVEEIKC